MKRDCEFSKLCGGGHTTAQHHMSVYERVIKQQCGVIAYYSILDAVNLAAKQEDGHGNNRTDGD